MTVPRTNWTGVLFGLAVAVIAAFQQFKLPPALPLMIERYGYDLVLAGGFMSVFAVAGLALSWNLGRAMQRLGLAPFLYGAFALSLAGSALTLAVPESGPVVLVARALEGVGFAILAIAGPTFASVNASPRHLPIAAGLTATWIPIGQVAAGLIALPLVADGHWQPLWWIAIALALAGVAATGLLGASGRVDLAGRPAGGAAPAPSAAERLTVVLVAAIFLLWSAQYIGTMTWLPKLLIEAHGLESGTAILAYVLPVVVIGVFNVAGALALRRGVPAPLLMGAGLALQAAVWALLPWLRVDGLGLAALLVYGIGAGVTPTCLFALPGIVLGPGRAGPWSFGVLMAGRNLGVLAGPLLLAQAVKTLGGWEATAPVFTVVALAPLPAVAWLAHRLAAAPRPPGGGHGTRR